MNEYRCKKCGLLVACGDCSERFFRVEIEFEIKEKRDLRYIPEKEVKYKRTKNER